MHFTTVLYKCTNQQVRRGEETQVTRVVQGELVKCIKLISVIHPSQVVLLGIPHLELKGKPIIPCAISTTTTTHLDLYHRLYSKMQSKGKLYS